MLFTCLGKLIFSRPESANVYHDTEEPTCVSPHPKSIVFRFSQSAKALSLISLNVDGNFTELISQYLNASRSILVTPSGSSTIPVFSARHATTVVLVLLYTISFSVTKFLLLTTSICLTPYPVISLISPLSISLHPSIISVSGRFPS